MYFNLLILCGIFIQVIIGNFADQEIRKSPDLLLRQKRVISRIPDEDTRVLLKNAPFIVHLKHLNRINCVGSILSNHVVITTASCVPYDKSQYKILSKSVRSDCQGTSHNVTYINRQYGEHPGRSLDGIALLTVVPAFAYNRTVNKIELHSGLLIPGTIGTVYGWGFNCRTNDRGTKYPKFLRSIQVPIMAHQDCVNRYLHDNIRMSDKDICTFHPQRHCGHNDGGAPLVVDGELVGVHLWTGPDMIHQIDPQYPDVFAVLQHHIYSNWIKAQIQSIESQFATISNTTPM